MSKYLIAAYVGCLLVAAFFVIIFGGNPGIFFLSFVFHNAAFICLCLVYVLLKKLLKAGPIFSYTVSFIIALALFFAALYSINDVPLNDFIKGLFAHRDFWITLFPFILPNVAMITYADYKLNGQ